MRPAQVDLTSIFSDAQARESAFTSEYDVVVSQATTRTRRMTARATSVPIRCCEGVASGYIVHMRTM